MFPVQVWTSRLARLMLSHCSLSWPLTEGLYELGQEGATSPYVLSVAFYLQPVWAGLRVLAV